MARPHPSQPDPDDLWPACDEQPPGISIRPLRHGDLQALLTHLGHHDQHHDQDEGLVAGRRPATGGPMLAVRVRASVGRPGASAHAEYRRRRAAERARWTHSLPWRAGAVLAAALTAGLLGAQVAPDLVGLLAVAAAAGLGWRLQLDRDGMVWHGRHLLVSALRKVLWQADQADEVLGVADITVAAVVAVHGASVPWGLMRADGVTIVPARRGPDLLQAMPPILGPERVAWLADRARLRFRAAA